MTIVSDLYIEGLNGIKKSSHQYLVIITGNRLCGTSMLRSTLDKINKRPLDTNIFSHIVLQINIW